MKCRHRREKALRILIGLEQWNSKPFNFAAMRWPAKCKAFCMNSVNDSTVKQQLFQDLNNRF